MLKKSMMLLMILVVKSRGFRNQHFQDFLTEEIKEGHESQIQGLRHAASVDHTKQGKATTATPERLKDCAHARFKSLYIS